MYWGAYRLRRANGVTPVSARPPLRRARHDAAWRDPAQVGDPVGATRTRSTRGCSAHACAARFWDTLAERRLTLLVTREYEHLRARAHAPVGAARRVLSAAPAPVRARGRPPRAASCTSPARAIPNQVFDLAPATALTLAGRRGARAAGRAAAGAGARALPARRASTCTTSRWSAARCTRTRSGRTRSSASTPSGRCERVWWPRCIETRGRPAASAATTCSSTRSPPGRRLRASYLLRLDRRAVGAPPRPPQLPGRPARRDLLGRDARAGRARADAAALGAPARAAGSGSTTAATARSASRDDGRFDARGAPARLDARAGFHGDVAFVGTSRVMPALPRTTRPGSTRRAASAACTRSTRAAAACSAASSGRPATRSSRSSRCPRAARPGFRSAPGGARTRRERALFYGLRHPQRKGCNGR